MSLSPVRVSAQDLATLDAMERDALDAIENVTNPDAAEELLRKVKAIEQAVRLARVGAAQELKWFLVRLESMRRHGELLGQPMSKSEAGAVTRSNSSNSAERVAATRARQIADVPSEQREKYVAGVRDLIRRLEEGKTEIARADKPSIARLLRIARENPQPPDEVPTVTRTDDVTILHGDFRELLTNIAGATIITDPPYPREFLPLWSDLAALAADQQCASVVAMSGQALLPEVIAALSSRLTYRWCGAYLTDGPATRVWHHNVGTKWKPILVFDRGGERPFVTQDVFKSAGDDKRHHHWGQNERGMAQLVEAFTKPGDLVVDPFLGGGTTAVVCRELGRRFIGCDTDAAAVQTSLDRLAA